MTLPADKPLTERTEAAARRAEVDTPRMGTQWVYAAFARELETDLGLERESHETTKRMLADREDEIERLRGQRSEIPQILTATDHYRNGWNECLDRALLAVEGEQAKYIVARSGEGAAAVRVALEYAMDAMRKLRVP